MPRVHPLFKAIHVTRADTTFLRLGEVTIQIEEGEISALQVCEVADHLLQIFSLEIPAEHDEVARAIDVLRASVTGDTAPGYVRAVQLLLAGLDVADTALRLAASASKNGDGSGSPF